MRFRLSTFGTVSLEAADGHPLSATAFQRQRLALLALLAVAGDRGVSRDKVIACLWPEGDAERGGHSLGQALYGLRRVLDDPDVVLGRTELRLNAAVVASDVQDFEAAIRTGNTELAAELYRGAFLDGFYMRNAPDFEHWLEETRQHFAERAAIAIETLARQAAAKGDAGLAIQLWKRRAVLDPFSTRVTLELMRAMRSGGDRAGALRQAGVHERLLHETLGLELNPAVKELVAEIKSENGKESTVPVQQMIVARAAPMEEPPNTLDPTALPMTDPAMVTAGVALAGHSGGVAADPAAGATRAGLSGPRRWTMAAALVGAAVVAVIPMGSATSPAAPMARERLLVLPFTDQTRDRELQNVGLIVADWLAQGIARTELVPVVPVLAIRDEREWETEGGRTRRIALEAGARLVISGSYSSSDDSLRFEARIIDAETGETLHALDPVTSPRESPLAGVDLLRRRALASLAPLVDRRLAAAARVQSTPPSFEAYEIFAQGLDRHYGRKSDALPYFLGAYALDSSFTLALVYAMLQYDGFGQLAAADSLAGILAPRRDRLPPYERHILDYETARLRGDRLSEYAALREAARIAPGSLIAAFYLPRAALDLNRPAEALAELSEIDPDQGEASRLSSYWSVLASAYHMLGRYEEQLRVAEQMRTRFPEDSRNFHFWARTLAALGRMTDLRGVLDESLTSPSIPGWGPPGLRVHIAAHDELIAHGHPDEARNLLLRAVQFYATASEPITSIPRHRLGMAKALYRLGRYPQAKRLLDGLLVEKAFTGGDVIDIHAHLGFIAVRQGDRRGIEEADRWLSNPNMPYLFGMNTEFRAALAAIQGQEQRAVSLLQRATSEGRPYDPHKHAVFEYSSLRGYAPFERWLRPKG